MPALTLSQRTLPRPARQHWPDTTLAYSAVSWGPPECAHEPTLRVRRRGFQVERIDTQLIRAARHAAILRKVRALVAYCESAGIPSDWRSRLDVTERWNE